MKIIDIIRKSTPEQQGYPDSIALLEDGKENYLGQCGSCPNPFQPSTEKPWNDVYACLAEQEAKAKCIVHPKFKKCLIINEGGACQTLNPNYNRPLAKYVAYEIFVHCGDTDTWRGSKGCITIPPKDWLLFLKKIYVGEEFKLIIRKQEVVV